MVKGSIEWEHNPGEGLVLHIKPAAGEFFIGETRKHVLAARKEMLLALRNVIDTAINRIDAKEKKTEKKGSKIEVQ